MILNSFRGMMFFLFILIFNVVYAELRGLFSRRYPVKQCLDTDLFLTRIARINAD